MCVNAARMTMSLVVMVAGLTVLTTPRAEACSCVSPGSPTEELAKSTAVFEGLVLGSNSVAAGPSIYTRHVRFQVLKSWKGVEADTIASIGVPSGSSAGCGFDSMTDGSTWLVYAREVEGALTTSLCSRSLPRESAASDRLELGAPTDTGSVAPGSLGGTGGGGCSLADARPWRATGTVFVALALVGVVIRRRRFAF
jgi:hypothetical protein